MDRNSDPQYRSEDGCALRIWRDTAQNNFLSEQNGRPIFDEVIFVEVIAPGSGNSTPVFEAVRVLAKESGRKEPKYSLQYERFKKYIDDFISNEKSDASLTGTPLSQWPEMSRTFVAELKAAKIFTVDALAALPDTKLGSVGPDGRTWRAKAEAYLEAAKSGAFATALAAQLEDANQDKADLQAQIAELAGKIAELQASTGVAATTVTTRATKVNVAPVVEPAPVADVLAAPAAGVIDAMDGQLGNNQPII